MAVDGEQLRGLLHRDREALPDRFFTFKIIFLNSKGPFAHIKSVLKDFEKEASACYTHHRPALLIVFYAVGNDFPGIAVWIPFCGGTLPGTLSTSQIEPQFSRAHPMSKDADLVCW